MRDPENEVGYHAIHKRADEKFVFFNLQLLTITVFVFLRYIAQQPKNGTENRDQFN